MTILDQVIYLCFLLWQKETLKESIKDFNKRIKNDDWSIE